MINNKLTYYPSVTSSAVERSFGNDTFKMRSRLRSTGQYLDKQLYVSQI
jgi:hypothetical protein